MQKYLKKAGLKDLFSNEKGLLDILEKFDREEKLNTTFATKYSHMLNLDVNHFSKKPRVRISIMPEEPMEVLEPNTSTLEQRINDCKRLESLGWEVHWNFSPVVIYKNFTTDYRNLINSLLPRPCEVIFLTNHKNSMERASENVIKYIQHSNEIKNSSGVMRYKSKYKRKAVEWIRKVLEENNFKVRYIF